MVDNRIFSQKTDNKVSKMCKDFQSENKGVEG